MRMIQMATMVTGEYGGLGHCGMIGSDANGGWHSCCSHPSSWKGRWIDSVHLMAVHTCLDRALTTHHLDISPHAIVIVWFIDRWTWTLSSNVQPIHIFDEQSCLSSFSWPYALSDEQPRLSSVSWPFVSPTREDRVEQNVFDSYYPFTSLLLMFLGYEHVHVDVACFRLIGKLTFFNLTVVCGYIVSIFIDCINVSLFILYKFHFIYY